MSTVDFGWFVTLAVGFALGVVYAHREAIADRLGRWRWLCGDDDDEWPAAYPRSHPSVRVLRDRPYDWTRDEEDRA